MLLFRSEEHVDRWCRQWSVKRGAVLSFDQGWQLAQAWFGPDRRQPDWRRKSVEEVEALFEELYLMSDFWTLRSPGAG